MNKTYMYTSLSHSGSLISHPLSFCHFFLSLFLYCLVYSTFLVCHNFYRSQNEFINFLYLHKITAFFYADWVVLHRKYTDGCIPCNMRVQTSTLTGADLTWLHLYGRKLAFGVQDCALKGAGVVYFSRGANMYLYFLVCVCVVLQLQMNHQWHKALGGKEFNMVKQSDQ